MFQAQRAWELVKVHGKFHVDLGKLRAPGTAQALTGSAQTGPTGHEAFREAQGIQAVGQEGHGEPLTVPALERQTRAQCALSAVLLAGSRNLANPVLPAAGRRPAWWATQKTAQAVFMWAFPHPKPGDVGRTQQHC